MMILLITSLITNAGDQQIVLVAIHENTCFSKRAAVALLIYPTSSLAVAIKIRARL